MRATGGQGEEEQHWAQTRRWKEFIGRSSKDKDYLEDEYLAGSSGESPVESGSH